MDAGGVQGDWWDAAGWRMIHAMSVIADGIIISGFLAKLLVMLYIEAGGK